MAASRPRTSSAARIHKRRGACMRRLNPAVRSLLLACRRPRGSAGPPARPCPEALPSNSGRRYDRSVAGSLIFGAVAVLAIFLLLRFLHLLGFLGYCILAAIAAAVAGGFRLLPRLIRASFWPLLKLAQLAGWMRRQCAGAHG